uniref:Fibronectin type-II domain-containing protein n=1 Tax=Globodera pallida TaxID=36090 RepID=A0A183BYE0_GLOPA
MRLLHLLAINAMLVPYCTALLKCRSEVVGTVRGAQRNAKFTKEECPRSTGGPWWKPDPQHKYCMVTYCTKGNEWFAVYGCTSTNERNWCSNQLAINLQKHFGDLVCMNCTLGGENEDYGNMHFALRPETTTPPARVPPKTTTTAKKVPEMTTTAKKVPEMTTTEMPWHPIILPNHATGLKIALPLVVVGLAIFCGMFFGHTFE